MKRLRILCLHGYTQNAIMFSKRTAAVRQSVEDIADLVYVTAPHYIHSPTLTSISERVEAEKEDISEEHKPYGWWLLPKLAPAQNGYLVGFKESVEYIKDVLIKEGPFDGILGFSQGAGFAALLTKLMEDRSDLPDIIPPTFEHPPFRFAIIVAGFNAKYQTATKELLEKKSAVKTPSLHYIGDTDTLISPETMLSLTAAFEKPTVFRHPGGHYLPYTSDSKEAFNKFIRQFA
ncbi:serine hydrolase FSH [Pilobolus umbonatus]|nr:serine hydrolase FSH [Pilobolus umbonatus]